MKKQKKINAVMAKLAFKAATISANSTSSYWIYQPKMPEKAKSLRKF